MSLLKLIGFAGETPKVVPRLLGDTNAQLASNVRLDDGALTPFRKQAFTYQFPAANYDTIYKYGDTWLGWVGDVYATPGPVAADRLYIMGNGAPRMRVGAAEYPLALGYPTAALGVSISGTATSDLGSDRLYAYTFVTQFGEESEPSPVSVATYWRPGQSVTLSGFQAPPAGRGINKQRIYRAQTSSTGTMLYFIAERDASAANFVDSVPADGFQEALPSAEWNAPPATLTGLSAGPNGNMAAFTGKDLYFCEPFRPHAWPEKYVLTTDYPIVGLAWFGSYLAVMTTGTPYVVSGTTPDTMTMEKLEQNLPCINARGIVDMGYAVIYPTHDGLVQVSSSGAVVITETLFSRDDWLQLNPYGMVAGQYNRRYYASYAYSDVLGATFSGTFIFDLSGGTPFIIRADIQPRAMFFEITTGKLFMLVDAQVFEWDALGEANALLAWRSKLFVMPKPTNFGAILVEADQGTTNEQQLAQEREAADAIRDNAAIFAQRSIGGELAGGALGGFTVNGDLMKPVPKIQRTLSVNVFADRKLVATVGRLNRVARLPAGFLATLWEVEVTGDTQITQIKLATTAGELTGA